jgi:hypothetical protein
MYILLINFLDLIINLVKSLKSFLKIVSLKNKNLN